MMIFIVIIHIIACIMLIAVILLQAGKGHGLAGSSFGGEMQTVFGTKTATFMSKLTTGCAIAFLVTCLTIDIMSSKKGKSLLEGTNPQFSEEQLEEVLKSLQEVKGDAKGVVSDLKSVSSDDIAPAPEPVSVPKIPAEALNSES